MDAVAMKRESGFTLLEVLIAMLIGTIGLLGTIAVQQAIINASKNANDSAIAMRLASQKIEELSSMCAETEAADMLVGLGRIAPPPGGLPMWQPTDASKAPVPEYVNAEGVYLRDSNGWAIPPEPADVGRYRWRRQWKVANTGALLPYVISVIVTYDNDVGDPKTTRLDLERRKSW
jgi:prepilin-type N-terminal cleavage/methylation domain-containing protein